ncbi:MAG: hypothetical protein HUJ25_07375 [Crocinitomicaceae bacterium]|nr:hypothetical protein [Crocinitomicaceae bacterium]
MIKVNMGMSREMIDHYRIQKSINDTGDVKLDFLSWSPTVSYSHEFIFGQVISASGTVGFQYMNLYYGSRHYGAPFFYISANPQLSIFYRKNFEYYIKLQIGGTFYIHNPEVIPEPTRRLLPKKANLFTGVTLGGFNFFLTDKLGLNLELSFWSAEMVTFGLTYRFFSGDLPEIQNGGEGVNDQLQDKVP